MSKSKASFYYFPKLADAVKGKGWNMNQFKSEAYKISSTPSAGSWSKSMSDSKGITKAYIVRASQTLKKLGFDESVCDYIECSTNR